MVWPGPHSNPSPDVIGDGDSRPGLLARWPWLKKLAIIAGPVLAAGVIAAAAVMLSGSPSASPARSTLQPARPDRSARISSSMYDRAQADGTFAGGTVAGHVWQMAVQNVAGDSGHCQPAVTVNGMDADPLYPGTPQATPVGDPAFMA